MLTGPAAKSTLWEQLTAPMDAQERRYRSIASPLIVAGLIALVYVWVWAGGVGTAHSPPYRGVTPAMNATKTPKTPRPPVMTTVTVLGAAFLLLCSGGCLAALTPASAPADAQAAKSGLEAADRARAATQQMNEQQRRQELQAQQMQRLQQK